MTVLEKILFLQNSINLSDKDFCARYKINRFFFTQWKLFKKDPKEKHIKYLITSFNIDAHDFMDPKSTLSDEILPGEHRCKTKELNIEDKNLIYEDFAREENGRYEEKD